MQLFYLRYVDTCKVHRLVYIHPNRALVMSPPLALIYGPQFLKMAFYRPIVSYRKKREHEE